MGRFIILSGPSCVGKGPLIAALKRLYPDLIENMKPVVLYNSRAPRPGEMDGEDYFFRSREEIEKFVDDNRYLVMDVRGDLQALDLEELKENLTENDLLFEGNPFMGKILVELPLPKSVVRLTSFLSPLSREEILFLKDPVRRIDLEVLLTDIMRRKLLRRTQKQKGNLSALDLEEIETRASSALAELQLAHHFKNIIPNHDGEDSENWTAFYYPVGDAFRTLMAFVAFLQEKDSCYVENWEPTLIK